MKNCFESPSVRIPETSIHKQATMKIVSHTNMKSYPEDRYFCSLVYSMTHTVHSYHTAASIADIQRTQAHLFVNIVFDSHISKRLRYIRATLTAKPFLLNVFDFLPGEFLRRSPRRNDSGVIHWHRFRR